MCPEVSNASLSRHIFCQRECYIRTSVYDYSAFALKIVELCRQRGSTEFVQAAAEELPFADGSFDAVYSVYMFHEMPVRS